MNNSEDDPNSHRSCRTWDNLATRLRDEVFKSPITTTLHTILRIGRGNGGDRSRSDGPCGVSVFIEIVKAEEDIYLEVEETKWRS